MKSYVFVMFLFCSLIGSQQALAGRRFELSGSVMLDAAAEVTVSGNNCVARISGGLQCPIRPDRDDDVFLITFGSLGEISFEGRDTRRALRTGCACTVPTGANSADWHCDCPVLEDGTGVFNFSGQCQSSNSNAVETISASATYSIICD